MLNLLRWGADIRSWEGLPLPDADARKAGVNDRELKMAEQLIEDMSGEWKADEYEDRFRDRIMALVERKAEAGQAQDVAKLEPQEQASSGAKILDLTELLQRSLRGGKGRAAAKDDEDEEADEGEDDGPARTKGGAGKRPAAKAPAKKAAAKSASARKAAPRRKAA